MIKMKLNTAAKIQKAATALLLLAILPFAIVGKLITICHMPFEWLFGAFMKALFRIGHGLMLHSEEVKNGLIRNETCLRNWTAKQAFDYLQKTSRQDINPELAAKIEKTRQEFREGKGISLNSRDEMEKWFDSL